MSTPSNRLREIRLDKGLTQLELAVQAGVFLKLNRVLILGAQAQYDHCRMGSGAGRIDPGGFHIGLLVGVEY